MVKYQKHVFLKGSLQLKSEGVTTLDNTAQDMRFMPMLEPLVSAVAPSNLCKKGDQLAVQ